MSSTDFTTRSRELGGDQQLLLPALAEGRVDFGLRMWMLNLRSPRTVETYTKTMTRFRAFLGGLGYDLDGDRRIIALSARGVDGTQSDHVIRCDLDRWPSNLQ